VVIGYGITYLEDEYINGLILEARRLFKNK